MNTKTHKSLMSGDLKLIDAINSKQIELNRNTNNIPYLMGLIPTRTDVIQLFKSD
jgi:hypothetical protein